ncbi:MAG: hypothetical protein DI547_11425 [Sphingobium sp.]|nr:MAG: hypothetical protein DI547_11425 [Sphingobium sp.]
MRNRLLVLLPAASACLALSACASGPQQPPKLNPKQAEALEKELAGKVAGEKVSCISQSAHMDMRAISAEVLLYKSGRNLVYQNRLIGRCGGLERGDVPIITSYGGQLCRGDMVRVADLVSGIQTGACALGDFVPYRKPKPDQ